MEVTHGGKYENLPTPTHSDYTMKFVGWYIDGTDILVTNGATVTIVNDVTLVARWAQDIYYNVTFDTDGGTSIPPQSVIENGTVTKPNDPEKSGYTFKGWYKESYFLNEYNFNSKVTGDTIIFAKWSPNKYTVKFHPNGGTGSMADMPFTYDIEQTLAENTFEREGYTFKGWFAIIDSVERNFADKESVKNLTSEDGAVITLYAKWEASRYTVSFDSNGGTDVSSQSIEYGKTAVKPTSPSKYGYTFDGWFIGDESYNFATPVKKDIVLTAKWTPQTYTVIYNGNGAIGGNMVNSTFKYDATYILPANKFEKYGYNFKGWTETKDGAVKYKDHQEGLYNLAVPNGTVTLYAVWEPKPISIYYELNEGYGWINNTNGYYDQNITLEHGANIDRLGYTLKEWNTQKDGKGTSYKVGGTYKNITDGSLTLYAIWEPNQYNLGFDTLGEGTVTPRNITVTYTGTYPELPVPELTNSSLNFVRWEIDGVEIRQGMTVDIFEDKVAKAVYTTNNVYTVTIKGYNGEGKDYVFTLEQGKVINAPSDPVVTGLTLEGYYTDSNYTNKYVWGDTILGNVVIYAKLVTSTYTVIFTANSRIYDQNGTTYGTRVYIYDVPHGTAIKPNDYYAEDFYNVLSNWNYFKDWKVDDVRLSSDKDFEYAITKETTFVAYYEQKAHEAGGMNSVSFDTNGGTFIEPQDVEAYSRVQKPQDPEKEGYTFAGWYTDPQLTNEFDFETVLGTNMFFTLYAKWAKESYTVSFVDTILGTVIAPVTVNYNETMEGKMPIVPVVDGWKFDGWYTDEFRTNLFDVTTKITENITLYAFWLKDVGSGTTHKVSFDTQSDIVIADVYVADGLYVMEPMVIMTKEGYRFDKWYLNGSAYDFNLPVLSDITLVANWIKVHTVSFETDGGSIINPVTVDDNKTIEKPIDPEKDGFVFFGWFTDSECTDQNKFDFDTPITSDITLYAKWVDKEDLNPVKVTFHYNSWTGDTLAGAPIELYAGQSIDNTTLKDKKYKDIPFFDEDFVYAGYVKDQTVSSVYTEKYQDMVEYDWWYQDASGKWKLFSEDVIVNEDTDVYLKIKRLNIDIQAPAITEQGYVFDVYYTDTTRIIDSIKNLLYTQDTVYKMNDIDRWTHLDILNIAREDIIYDDKIIEQLIDKNIIDEDYNILIQEFMVRYSQVLGKDNVEKFIVDSAKEQLDGSNEKLIEEFVEYFDKMATSSDISDRNYIKDMLSKSVVYTNQEQHIKDYAESHFSKDFLISLGFSEEEAENITKDMFHEWIENNTNEVIAKVIDYIVDKDDVNEIDNYSHIVIEYLDNHEDEKDEVVDGIIELNYRAELDKLVYEVNNKDKFSVTEKTIFIANGLKTKLLKDYSYDTMIAKVPEKILSKVFEIYPEEKAKEIYNGAFDSLVAQTEEAIRLAENNETGYVDCGLTFKINPVDDIYAPLYDSFVNILENDPRLDKIKDKIKYDENEYLPELVKLLSVETLFNGSITNETDTHSGYQIKDFDEYYNLVLNAIILSDDAVTKYKELYPEEEIQNILTAYEDLALKYVNVLAEFLDGYANGTKDPDNKYFDKIEGIIKSKFAGPYNKLLNWYKDSPLNKKYESSDYDKFRKAVKEAYDRYDMVTDVIFDDEYIDKVLSKLNRILVAENTKYTDYKGVTHESADIYEITVKGITGRFVVVNDDIYEISINNTVITIARELSN